MKRKPKKPLKLDPPPKRPAKKRWCPVIGQILLHLRDGLIIVEEINRDRDTLICRPLWTKHPEAN